jgi:hypothetical protein
VIQLHKLWVAASHLERCLQLCNLLTLKVIVSVNNTDMTGLSLSAARKVIRDTNTANELFVLGVASVRSVADALRAIPVSTVRMLTSALLIVEA